MKQDVLVSEITFTEREEKIRAILDRMPVSPSHAHDHIMNVIRHGLWLAQLHGGERDIIVAAALLHDLGRSDSSLKGRQTVTDAVQKAPDILVQSGYSREEITKITQCIDDHDDPKNHPQLLESRVLKDADFLDGFGARGIIRSLIYTGETHGGLSEALDRLQHKMSARLQGLEFPESRRLAWKLHRLSEIFLAELALSQTRDLVSVSYPGKFIALEGISGSGKDTQLELLHTTLEQMGKTVTVVHHPTDLMKSLWHEWKKQVDDPMSDAFLILADRIRTINKEVMPALQQGAYVISSRSVWSSQAYQAKDEWTRAFYRFCFAFEPVADAYLYLKVDPEQALERIRQRLQQPGQEKDPGVFPQSQLSIAQAYEATQQFFPQVEVVDANQPQDMVHQAILEVLRRLGLVVI